MMPCGAVASPCPGRGVRSNRWMCSNRSSGCFRSLSRRSEARPFPFEKRNLSYDEIRQGLMVEYCQRVDITTLRLDPFVST